MFAASSATAFIASSSLPQLPVYRRGKSHPERSGITSCEALG